MFVNSPFAINSLGTKSMFQSLTLPYFFQDSPPAGTLVSFLKSCTVRLFRRKMEFKCYHIGKADEKGLITWRWKYTISLSQSKTCLHGLPKLVRDPSRMIMTQVNPQVQIIIIDLESSC